MTQPDPSAAPLTPEQIASLLETAQRARQRGNESGARALLHALVARAPDQPRAWLLLGAVAETREEQRQALVRVLELEPDNLIAQRVLGQIEQATAPLPPVVEAPIVEPATTAQEAETVVAPVVYAPRAEEAALEPEGRPPRLPRWPLFVVLGSAAVLVLIAALFLWRPAPEPTADMLPAGAPTQAPILAATTIVLATPTAEVPSVQSTAPATPEAPGTTIEPLPPTAQPNQQPGQPTEASLPIGRIASQGSWEVGLMRPNDALMLSGSINDLQPKGRFVMALVAVSNTSPNDQVLPRDLLELVDAQGRRYQALPAASTAYLAAFGTGQAGVVSMERSLPAGGNVVSVPVIFDVPADARGLRLVLGTGDDGWQISG